MRGADAGDLRQLRHGQVLIQVRLDVFGHALQLSLRQTR
jgi:hypothetical protein